jgi:hypothetical protein
MGKYLCYIFPIKNGLKQRYVSLPFLFKFALEYVIRNIKENQVGLILNGTHELLVYADVNLMGADINTIKKNKEPVADAGKDVRLEVNTEHMKYMLMSHHQNTGQSYSIKITNGAFESVAKFIYFGMAVTYKNLIHKEIKSRLTSCNVFCHSVQNSPNKLIPP